MPWIVNEKVRVFAKVIFWFQNKVIFELNKDKEFF